MGGLAVLFLIGLYITLTAIIIAKTQPIGAKGLVLLAALLIPTADAMYGRIKLKHMCQAEGGLKVYRVAEYVEGFMGDSADETWIKQYGYQFSEGDSSPGKYYRISKQNGQTVREDNVSPKSQYVVSSKYTGSRKNSYLRHQYFIKSTSNELLATDTQIAFNGGWAEKFLAQFSDAGVSSVAWCTNTELDPVLRRRNMILSTLKHTGE